MNLYTRFMMAITQARVQWLMASEEKHITSLDLLDMAVSTTRAAKESGDKAMLIDCLANYLIPNLQQVLEWAEETVELRGL